MPGSAAATAARKRARYRAPPSKTRVRPWREGSARHGAMRSGYRVPRASLHRQDHVAHHRIDLVLPALTGEHPVVPDAGLHMVRADAASARRRVVRGHVCPSAQMSSRPPSTVSSAVCGSRPDRRPGRATCSSPAPARRAGTHVRSSRDRTPRSGRHRKIFVIELLDPRRLGDLAAGEMAVPERAGARLRERGIRCAARAALGHRPEGLIAPRRSSVVSGPVTTSVIDPSEDPLRGGFVSASAMIAASSPTSSMARPSPVGTSPGSWRVATARRRPDERRGPHRLPLGDRGHPRLQLCRSPRGR